MQIVVAPASPKTRDAPPARTMNERKRYLLRELEKNEEEEEEAHKK